MDLIDRQAAIDEVLCFADEQESDDGLWHWTGIKAMLENLPPAQPEWIPCSERLPEEDGHYLVTMKRIAPDNLGGNFIETRKMRLHDGEWRLPVHSPDWINDEIEDKVLAWMPLPEPYAGRRLKE